MAQKQWIGGTGSQPWSTAGNWSPSGVPANGDDVSILVGTSNIDSGLNQSAVTLNSLTIGSGFTGTIGAAGDTGAYLQINTPSLLVLSAPSAGGFLSGGFTRFKWDAGAATDFVAVVKTTGNGADPGRGALQVKGGTAASKMYVTGGTVDLAAKPGETGTLAELDVTGGTVVCGSGLTCPTIIQNGSASSLTVNGAVTTLTQQAGTLNTFGTSLITTAYVNGTANFGHRPSGNAFTNLTIDGAGAADFAGDPRGVLFANAPQLYEGAKLTAFSPDQLKLAGPVDFKFKLVNVPLGKVTVDLGERAAGVTYTVT